MAKIPQLGRFQIATCCHRRETGTATFQSHSHFHLHALILDSQKSPLACVIFIMSFFFITCHTKIPPASDTTTSRSSKFASIPLSGSLEDGPGAKSGSCGPWPAGGEACLCAARCGSLCISSYADEG